MRLPQLGDVVDDRYLIEAELGRGAMGVVFSGRNVAGNFPVAIKWLLPPLQVEPRARERFIQEAQLAAQIRSRNVIRIYDVGVSQPFFVMEHLHGQGLRDLLVQHAGPLAVKEVARHFLPILDGVQEAHNTVTEAGRGVIHRDLKPDNVFLADAAGGSVPIVLDFGIARLAEVQQAVTSRTTRSILGTPVYMAKEQLFAPETIGPWTDVHALGVILYEMLAGRRPFEATEGQTIWDLAVKIGTGQFEPLVHLFGQHDDPWWQAMDRVLAQAMAPEVNARYQSVEALRAEVEPLLAHSKQPAGGGRLAGEYRVGAATEPLLQSIGMSSDAMRWKGSSVGPVTLPETRGTHVDGETGLSRFGSRHRGKIGFTLAGVVLAVAGLAPLFLVRDKPLAPSGVSAPARPDKTSAAASTHADPQTETSAQDTSQGIVEGASDWEGDGRDMAGVDRNEIRPLSGATGVGGAAPTGVGGAALDGPEPSPLQTVPALDPPRQAKAATPVKTKVHTVTKFTPVEREQPSATKKVGRTKKDTPAEREVTAAGAPASEPDTDAPRTVDPISNNRPRNALDAIGLNRPSGAVRKAAPPGQTSVTQSNKQGGEAK